MHKIFLLAVASALCISAAAHAAYVNPIHQNDVLAYLDQLMEWQRDAMTLEPSANNARERIFRDTLQQNATQVLENGFAFARVVATYQPVVQSEATGEGQTPEENPRLRLQQRIVEIDAAVAAMQKQSRAASAAQRSELNDQIKLEMAKRELLTSILANMSSATSKTSTDFAGKIEGLARSIPELNPDAPKSSAKATVSAQPLAPVTRKSTSIMSLSGDLFHLMRKKRELQDMVTRTIDVKRASRAFIASLRDALENEGGKPTESEDQPPAVPLGTIEERVESYKEIGAHIVPLGETASAIVRSERTLNEWTQVLDRQIQTLLRQLGLRLTILLITLAIPLIVGELLRRTIKRCISDQKRQRQVNAIRRVLAGIVVLSILLMHFISDFSSFATFAGFLTAGLAVALQSVLLSLVAHFFFYGRYGVRKGDRVHVSGVTGDIMQIGMVRFHLRELQEGAGGEMHPTGKTVAFPNAILFQNVAFYKYV